MTDEYPECERYAKISSQWGAIREFFDFLIYEKDIHLGTADPDDEGEFFFFSLGDDFLYEFFNIDPNKLETERRLMLKRLSEK
jgi:hypothetical protein